MHHEAAFVFALAAIAVVILGLGLMARYLTRVVPTLGAPGTGSGTSGPGRFGASVVLITALVIMASAISRIMAGHRDPIGDLVLLVALGFALRAVGYLLSRYDLRWDESGITGPGTLWCPPIGPRRSTLRWSDLRRRETFIVKSDAASGNSARLATGYRLIDAQGRRIVWSGSFRHSRQLCEDVSTYRPDLPGAYAWPAPRPEAPAAVSPG